MITAILSDFSRVILYPKNPDYSGTLNGLYKELKAKNEPIVFTDYFSFNEDLLSLYRSLTPVYSVNIFTTGSIQNAPEVQEKIRTVFRNIYSAESFGLSKQDPAAYVFISGKLNKPPEEVLYIDDQQKNIQAAATAGLQILHYEDFSRLQSDMTRLLCQ